MADVNDMAAWKRLTGLLDDDELLWPRVREALDEDEGDNDGDAWEALIGGLDDAGALAYLDAEDTGMELADALAQLPRVFRLQPDLGAVNDTDDLAEALAAADAVLAAGECRLLELDDGDAEAHALVVVPAENVDEILELAGALDRSVATFS
ncbi:MAG: hypothetical protein JWR33_1543 [Naasia sp.]|jgi:hypothetical protein|uniref:DUF6630 family protein n=1 Tax=Naasia sp. TaxID=2546198 RepID=UPI0026024635|nr:hypothetical protein [Naasia sp.]MCU1570802.1 hypothetical protein [Naasia sp.]